VFEDENDLVLVLEEVVETDDARVIEPHEHLGFALEHLGPTQVGSVAARELEQADALEASGPSLPRHVLLGLS
jgi:hypothetical protein